MPSPAPISSRQDGRVRDLPDAIGKLDQVAEQATRKDANATHQPGGEIGAGQRALPGIR